MEKNISIVSEHKWKFFHFYLEFRTLTSTTMQEASHTPLSTAAKKGLFIFSAQYDTSGVLSDPVSLSSPLPASINLQPHILLRASCLLSHSLLQNPTGIAPHPFLPLLVLHHFLFQPQLSPSTLHYYTPLPVRVCSPLQPWLAQMLLCISVMFKEHQKSHMKHFFNSLASKTVE